MVWAGLAALVHEGVGSLALGFAVGACRLAAAHDLAVEWGAATGAGDAHSGQRGVWVIVLRCSTIAVTRLFLVSSLARMPLISVSMETKWSVFEVTIDFTTAMSSERLGFQNLAPRFSISGASAGLVQVTDSRCTAVRDWLRAFS